MLGMSENGASATFLAGFRRRFRVFACVGVYVRVCARAGVLVCDFGVLVFETCKSLQRMECGL